MKLHGRIAVVAAIPLLVAALLAACAAPTRTARTHPEEVKGRPVCTSCHEAPFARYDHGLAFATNHRDAARQESGLCELCHRPSACADCHAAKERLKPSDKRAGNPATPAPHRGDYLTQHRIDGRINPAPCFGCHGRKNEWRCRECHR